MTKYVHMTHKCISNCLSSEDRVNDIKLYFKLLSQNLWSQNLSKEDDFDLPENWYLKRIENKSVLFL